jgi:hypothetical protein
MKMEIEWSKEEVEALLAATVEGRYPAPPDCMWTAEWYRYEEVVKVRLEKIVPPKSVDDLVPEPAPAATAEGPF